MNRPDPNCPDCGVTLLCRYHRWENEVDRKIQGHHAVHGEFGLDMLPDTDTRAMFEANLLPADAALDVLREVGFLDDNNEVIADLNDPFGEDR